MKRFRVILSVMLLMALTTIVTACSSDIDNVEAAYDGQGMSVHYIDVGQGDATLVMQGDHAMLIDAGPEDSGTRLQQYLQKQGVSSLDYLVLTHPDSDHIGGGDVIITKFECGQVMMSELVKDTTSYRDVKSALSYKGYEPVVPAVGSVYALGDASFEVIGPIQSAQDANNSSIAVLLTYGNNRFLFTGDAQEEEETDILNSGADVRADVYQVGHHGSRTSSSENFLQAVQPAYAVISCGEDNSYGHPHAEVMNRLRSMGVKIFRTDEQGSIIAYSNGREITWNASSSETWQSGEPKGSSQEYILNTGTHKFHRSDCSSVEQMADTNKEVTHESRDSIIAQGYEPCKRCNP